MYIRPEVELVGGNIARFGTLDELISGRLLRFTIRRQTGCRRNFLTKEEISAKDDAICRGYGTKPGEQLYIQCRMTQDQRRDGVRNSPIDPLPGQVRRY